jgi:hypothetical protein
MSLSFDQTIAVISAIAAVAGLVVALLPSLIQYLYSQGKAVKAHYNMVWQNSLRLKRSRKLRAILLGNRPFQERYYLRLPQVQRLRQALKNGQRVAVVGAPISGKTRMAYEVLHQNTWDLLMPRCVAIDLEKFFWPRRFSIIWWRRKLVVLDDLQRLVEQPNFDFLLKELLQQGWPAIATCRSGEEWEKTCNKLQASNLEWQSLFPLTIELERVEDAEAEDIARDAHINWQEKQA